MDFREPGWQRWLLVLADGVVYGHCSLKSDALRVGMHRCELGIGLEVAVRSSGLGTRLLEHALQLAASAMTIDWVDLRVLGKNRRAIALYEKFGFQTIAVVSDRFRIGGESIDEVIMTRRLAKGSV
jgi:RimJ/RimL family protein N-acetyltransferase